MGIFIIVIQVAVAGYMLFAAASGKSRLFASPYTKKGKEERYKKTGRICFLVTGLLMLAMGAVNIMAMPMADDAPALQTLATVSTVLSFAVLTALVVTWLLLRTLHDPEKRTAPARPKASRAAFYFDEEDEEKK
ncbi:hypothetical protein LJC07_02340 [Christensenellaceae bacterium OttesenSCG-928-L17]|nr:hypothetical protein [Christensenellaceae bacterium OttesenSCG-928-L17]